MRALAAERNAVILAHNYQLPEVQDVADYVGDSLGLSQQAAATEADVIVFAGVHFMAETAAILAPTAHRADPRPRGRLLAGRHDRRRRARATWKAENPGAVVVSYVNTTAEVKALSRLLLHVGQRRDGDRGDPRGPRHPVPARTCSWAPTWSGSPAAR